VDERVGAKPVFPFGNGADRVCAKPQDRRGLPARGRCKCCMIGRDGGSTMAMIEAAAKSVWCCAVVRSTTQIDHAPTAVLTVPATAPWTVSTGPVETS
jgi:hypothetical protein